MRSVKAVREARGLSARSLSAAVLTVLLVVLACLAASAPAGARAVNVEISLYRNPGESDRAIYDSIIGAFADGVYESSNGAITIGRVTFFADPTRTKPRTIMWGETGDSVCATVSGWGTSTGRIVMWDQRPTRNVDYMEKPVEAGYALAHEWGHYFFGLFDEYKSGSTKYDDQPPEPDGTPGKKWPSMPHSTDVPTRYSIMTAQYNAVGGPGFYSWLNFSTSVDYQDETAQGRMFGASGWETLTRPPAEDPKPPAETNEKPRQNLSRELQDVRGPNNRPRIDLPNAAARADLKIEWMADVPAAELVLPRSASMAAEGKMAAAKQAAEAFVEAAPLGSMVGVVAYDDVATVVQPLTLLAGAADRERLVAAIDGITPHAAGAAVGDAAQLALESIAALGEQAPGAVFLLADRASDAGCDPLSVAAAYQARGVPLSTIACGEGADEALLGALAEETSGAAYAAGADLGELTEALLSAEQQATAAVSLAAPAGSVAAGAVVEYPFEVDASLTALSAVLTHAGASGDALVEALAPDGEVAATAVAEQAGGAVQQSLKVANPAPGLWHLRVSSAAAHALALSGLVTGSPGEGGSAVLTVDAEDTRYPRPLAVSAQLWGERPLAGARVTALVAAPDGSQRDLLLRDDGKEGDAFAGDGVYSALLEARRNGVYTFSVSAQAAAGSAYYTSLGLGLAPSEGDSGDPPPDVPLSASLERFALAQVTVSGVGADDHGHDIATATPVVADDSDVPGEIDAAGDHDFFRVALPAGERALTFRVTGLAFGMEPRLTLRDAAGAVLCGPLQLGEGTDEYLFTQLTGLEPGSVLYAEVADAEAAGSGTYCFSAGPAIASDELLPSTIAASAGPGGTISPEGAVSVAHGAAQLFTIIPHAHYHTADVLVDGASLGPLAVYTFSNVTADHAISATFAPDSCTVTPSVVGGLSGHGTITPATPQTVPWGSTLTFSFAAAPGYEVGTVTVDGRVLLRPTPRDGRDEYTFAALEADHTISVSFAVPAAPGPRRLPRYANMP